VRAARGNDVGGASTAFVQELLKYIRIISIL
jgi:hypothetical protein